MAKMTIRACMNAALQLLNQYSIAGTLVPLSYNDQADTELRMVNLINDAQMTIATTVKPIEEALTFEVPILDHSVPDAMIEQKMPEEFNHQLALYFTPAEGNRMPMPLDANRYKWIGDDLLLVPNRPAGQYRLTYNRFPVRYDETTDKETTELDNKPDTHEIIPYYVAAMIAVDENPKAYYALYNVWETRLVRLGYRPPHAVSTQVSDVYGFDDFGGVW